MSKQDKAEKPAKTNKKQTTSVKAGIIKVVKRVMRWASFIILVSLAFEGVQVLVKTGTNFKQALGVLVVGFLVYICLID